MLFSEMTVGNCNREAYDAATAVVAQYPEKTANPLFLWGRSGTGKTRLLKTIGCEVQGKQKTAKVLYQTTEEYVALMIASIKEEQDEILTSAYEGIDLLLLDNLEEIIAKDATQGRLAEILLLLERHCTQIVLAANCEKRGLRYLRNLLKDRCPAYREIDLQLLDEETISREAMRYDRIIITDDYLELLKAGPRLNFFSLNGKLKSISALELHLKDWKEQT